MDVHGCIREGQKTTLALIPQVPSSLVFKMGSLAGLELTTLATLDSLESTSVTFLLQELHTFPGFPAEDLSQALHLCSKLC